MMSRSSEGRQVKPGLGKAVQGSMKDTGNGDATYESVSEDQGEMDQGPSEKVRTGREQKAKPALKASGAYMGGGSQDQCRGSIMSNKYR